MLRIHRLLLAIAYATLLCACATPSTSRVLERERPPEVAAPDPGGRELAARIAAFLDQPRFAGAHWGIHVRRLDTGTPLISHAGERRAVPASNTKLYSGALAAALLGPDRRFTTRLQATAQPGSDGILDGDLILRGGGDPALGRALHAEDDPDGWRNGFAQALVARGVQAIRGDLVADITYYQASPVGSGWSSGDLLYGYGATAPALGLDSNRVAFSLSADGVPVAPVHAGFQVRLRPGDGSAAGPADGPALYRPLGTPDLYVYGRVPAPGDSAAGQQWTLAAPDPARMAANALLESLQRHGIQVLGSIRVQAWPEAPVASAVTFAEHASAPLSEHLKLLLKDSDNQVAQHLFLQAGLAARERGGCAELETPPRTTEAWGVCAMREYLASAGIDPYKALIAEGSGLSRANLIAPSATTALLVHATRQPWYAAYLDGFPIAGVDGTLRSRLIGTPAEGRLRAKTGTLSYTSALSGIVDSADGVPLAFSIMLDRHLPPAATPGEPPRPTPRDDIDVIATMIAEAEVE